MDASILDAARLGRRSAHTLIAAATLLLGGGIADAQSTSESSHSTVEQFSLTEPAPSIDSTEEDRDLLSEQSIVADVLANNPSVDQMIAAWRAAQSRIRQDRALDDPMVTASVAPQSFQSNDVGYRIEASQKLFFPGKRNLRGRAAAFEACAAEKDVVRIRQQLAEEASQAYYDYFLASRSMAINAESLEIVKQMKANAESRFATGRSLQQDVLQAEVELGRLEEQRFALVRFEAVTRARLNTLLNRQADQQIGRVPSELATPTAPEEISQLQGRAVAQRPELQSLAQQAEAERSKWALAYKEYYPDYEVLGAYDTFWRAPDGDLRAMVGIRMNAPIRRGRRDAAVVEAQSRLAEKILGYRKMANDVQFEVAEAYEGVRESDAVVRLYGDKLIRTAEQSVNQAQTAYVTNRSDFLTLLTAQQNLIDLRLKYYQSLSEAFKRRAALRRAVGDPVGAG